MNLLDILFLVPLLFALYRGFKKGLIHMISSLAALVLGIVGAIKLRPVFASALDSVFSISPEYVHVIAFAVAFVSIVIIVHLVAFLVEKLVKAVALSLVNRVLGMAFGLLGTSFVISMILWPINEVNKEKQLIKPERIEGSLLYKPLSGFAPGIFSMFNMDEWKEYVPKKKDKGIRT
jgi:membrane protein required for colicin V production